MATNDNYIGIAMGLDVSSLKAGLSEANKQIQLANSEFKAASSGMEDWTKSSEGLTAKITQLTSVFDMQKRKLAGIQAEYDKVVAAQGENSEAARKLKVQLNNQQAVVNTTERELKNYKETLDGVEKGTIDLQSVTLKGGKAIKQLGEDAKESEGGFTILKGAVATFAGNILTSLVGKLKEASSALLGLADSTREYRQILATLEAGANDVGVSSDFVKDKFTDLMGVFNDQDAVTEGLNNLLTAGFDESTLDNITTSLEGAALKWKDTLKFEGLSDSLQEWIGSGGESLTGQFAELLERMGYNLEDVKAKTAGMTEEQRRNYAMNLLNSEGLNKVSEDYRKQNETMIAAQQANVNFQNSVAELGAKLEPITTKIREGFTKILDKILELLNGVDFDKLATDIANGFDYFINNILPTIVSGLQWIIDNKDILLAGIVAIGSAFLAWKVTSIIQGIVKAFKAWTLATQGQTIAQKLLNTAMKANPIGIVITLITALVTAFTILWNKSEGFRNFWIGLWEKIKSVVSGAWEGIKNIFSGIGDWFSGIGTNIVEGIWNGIKNSFKWLKDKITGWVGDVVDFLKKLFGIASPSKVMRDKIGVFLGEGVGEGILKSIPSVKKDISKFGDFIGNNLGGIKTGLSGANGVGTAAAGGTIINAGMNVTYNGNLSRKQLKQLENDNYNAIKMKLKMEGVV